MQQLTLTNGTDLNGIWIGNHALQDLFGRAIRNRPTTVLLSHTAKSGFQRLWVQHEPKHTWVLNTKSRKAHVFAFDGRTLLKAVTSGGSLWTRTVEGVK